jgi:predicted Zn finger-like uncharacterized protein
MSLITSCPACGTMFRVVPDQLKISEGWVRCGHCSEVFDATANLTDESILGPVADAQATTQPGSLPAAAERSAPARPPAAAPRPADSPTIPAPLQTRPAELYEPRPPVAQRPPAVPRAPVAPAPAGAPEAADSRTSSDPSDFFAEDSHATLEPSPLDAPFVFRPSELSVRDSAQPEPGRESQMLPGDFDEPEPVPNVSFVRQARRKAFWRRPFVRMMLALLTLALGAVLLLQAAYQDRDRLALAQPALRPALEHMCELLHCRLGPPRQIEAIVIDSSGFNRLRNDTYRLSFTLRNTGPVQVAAPAMELTITDSQDQTIARRVLTPAELGAENNVIAPATELSRSVGLVLNTGGAARVAGYRLLAFYP